MKVKVIGIGNPLASDDAVGLHVAHRLLRMNLPNNVEVITAESAGPSILESITRADKAILVDAAVGGSTPGTVHRLSLDDIQAGRCKIRSLHEIDLIDLLKIERLTRPESFPKKLVILGIEVADTRRYRQGLSNAVRNAIPQIVKAVLNEVTPELVSGR